MDISCCVKPHFSGDYPCNVYTKRLASGITLEFPENTNSVTNGRVIRMVSKAMEEMFCAATILFQPPALTTGKHGWVERIVRKILRVFMCE
ncbi:hypothetical protein V6N12_041297 [Hibiscus sabdariffa]|uniref:Uncharacterized protein n=1 Tax=Hibiscus sabdariffa TaxID=183260 RepID=A0ABR2E695_9ROSI